LSGAEGDDKTNAVENLLTLCKKFIVVARAVLGSDRD